MDVIARWRDAVTDPPPDGWRGLVSRDRRHEIVRWAYYNDSYKCFRDERRDQIDSTAYWLDITDEPAVPREAVQAAIKRIKDVQEMARGNDEYVAFGTAVDVIEEYTEVTHE